MSGHAQRRNRSGFTQTPELFSSWIKHLLNQNEIDKAKRAELEKKFEANGTIIGYINCNKTYSADKVAEVHYVICGSHFDIMLTLGAAFHELFIALEPRFQTKILEVHNQFKFAKVDDCKDSNIKGTVGRPKNEVAPKDLGRKIKFHRMIKGISNRGLSKIVGISNAYMVQIEQGIKIPSKEVISSIEKALDVDLNDKIDVDSGLDKLNEFIATSVVKQIKEVMGVLGN